MCFSQGINEQTSQAMMLSVWLSLPYIAVGHWAHREIQKASVKEASTIKSSGRESSLEIRHWNLMVP